MVMDAGETHWVVFSAGKPVAAYPKSTRPLEELIADANLNKKMTPEQFRARQTAASRRQKALDAAHGVVTQLRNRARTRRAGATRTRSGRRRSRSHPR